MDYVWLDAVEAKVRTAKAYYHDGACISGAKLLREAAELLEAEHRRRELLIKSLTVGS